MLSYSQDYSLLYMLVLLMSTVDKICITAVKLFQEWLWQIENKQSILFPKITNIGKFGLYERYKSTNLLEFWLYLQWLGLGSVPKELNKKKLGLSIYISRNDKYWQVWIRWKIKIHESIRVSVISAMTWTWFRAKRIIYEKAGTRLGLSCAEQMVKPS